MTTTSILSINLKLVCKKLNEIEKKEYIFHFYGMKDYSSFQDSKKGEKGHRNMIFRVLNMNKKPGIPYCADLTLLYKFHHSN